MNKAKPFSKDMLIDYNDLLLGDPTYKQEATLVYKCLKSEIKKCLVKIIWTGKRHYFNNNKKGLNYPFYHILFHKSLSSKQVREIRNKAIEYICNKGGGDTYWLRSRYIALDATDRFNDEDIFWFNPLD